MFHAADAKQVLQATATDRCCGQTGLVLPDLMQHY